VEGRGNLIIDYSPEGAKGTVAFIGSHLDVVAVTWTWCQPLPAPGRGIHSSWWGRYANNCCWWPVHCPLLRRENM